MAEYRAQISWERGEQDFLGKRYSRRHQIHLDGGLSLPASSSPQVVPEPWSDPAALDPEEGFVASLASCHMLWFLALAAEAGVNIDSYQDAASGVLARNEQGRMAMTAVTLRPRVRCSGSPRPSRATIEALHHAAHERCFIANSVSSRLHIEPQFE